MTSLANSQQQYPAYAKKDQNYEGISQGEKIALTDSDSNIFGKEDIESSQKIQERLSKEKAYSEFYKSRIIEVPIEL